MWCGRSHGADSGQVLADGVGESAHDYCHAHSLCGGWQGQQLAQTMYEYTPLSELACHFYTIVLMTYKNILPLAYLKGLNVHSELNFFPDNKKNSH